MTRTPRKYSIPFLSNAGPCSGNAMEQDAVLKLAAMKKKLTAKTTTAWIKEQLDAGASTVRELRELSRCTSAEERKTYRLSIERLVATHQEQPCTFVNICFLFQTGAGQKTTTASPRPFLYINLNEASVVGGKETAQDIENTMFWLKHSGHLPPEEPHTPSKPQSHIATEQQAVTNKNLEDER
ncbi:MAG: hypothetical protein Q9213_000651 [Squamulea squamosa]